MNPQQTPQKIYDPAWSNNFLSYYWNKGLYPSSRLCICLKKASGKQGLCDKHRSEWRYNNDPVFREKSRTGSSRRSKAYMLEKLNQDPEFRKRKQDLAARKISKLMGLDVTKTKKQKLSPLQRRYNFCMLQTKRRIKKRVDWTLTFDDFQLLIEQPCWYCNAPKGHTKFGSGLDRIDPKKGYSIDNVYPCCRICNTLKSDKFTAEETKIMVQCIKILRGESYLK